MVDIKTFAGDYWFLSNFYPSRICYNDRIYTSVEHAYQAAKATNGIDIETIRNAHSPREAKRLGRTIEIRPDWEDVKINIMLDLVRLKFRDAQLKIMLLRTGNKELIEGNTWNDTFWGICRGVGKNHLGKILTQVRGELV